MDVTFTRTGERRYAVSATGLGGVAMMMRTAPGYDSRLPHDLVHFIVEAELGIKLGLFGQLAAGGNAGGTFLAVEDARKQRHRTRRGERIMKLNERNAQRSEHAAWTCLQAWRTGTIDELGLHHAGITTADVRRVCQRFDEVSQLWSRLGVGHSLTLTWPHRVPLARLKRRA